MNGIHGVAAVDGRTTGDDARERNIAAGTALSELLRTTLGPNGRDKMLVDDGTVIVTNDGASIVDRLSLDSPAARLLAGVARAQRGELGDGSTAAIVLAGTLLAEAETLLDDGLHPTTVIAGYADAAGHARSLLDDLASAPDGEVDHRAVVSTAVTGRWDERRTAFLADLSTRAYRAARAGGDDADLSAITVHGAAGEATTDSELLDGLVIDTDTSSTSLSSIAADVPRRLTDVRIALLDDELTIQSPDSVSRYSVDSPDGLRRARDHERDEYRRYVETLRSHGVDVCFCQKSIDDGLRARLAKAGILAFERTRQDEVHKLSRATGARPVMRLDALDPSAVGRADELERVRLGKGSFVVVREASSRQVSVLLRGSPEHVVDETERIVSDGIALLETLDARPGLVPGGGATETELALAVRTFGRGVDDRRALAVDAFADALETVPVSLARNAGMDPVDSLLELRRRHADGERSVGVDGDTGTVTDVMARGVVEPVRLKDRVVANATDAATLVLRVDDVIRTRGTRGGEEHDHDHDHDHGHGGVRSDPGGYPWAIGH
ncbi:thermosome subunit alpha [Haloplanus rubicundus]|uniref:Thermosome subunit 1 n=1 Tax=Haloplanus rubicundus TaxID=1547898 RepID=A0A345ECN1_9EURY|nr:thermosome subunit alpha [Haloplanus rubicundus]AXG09953.1 thermosome subunit 1 [Haloplanus rubicundus]